MYQSIKRWFYFPVAHYLAWFAKIQLLIWKPRIFLVTGSSGKTTLLHLIESQLGEKARYSHKANSSFGIPFDVLGIKRSDLTIFEWPQIFLTAPLRALRRPPQEKLYVVEADCDRPGEGRFLSRLLKPEVTFWVSLSRTHSQSFDYLVSSGLFKSVEQAIAYEFGWFLEQTAKLVVVNGDSPEILRQLPRTSAETKAVKEADLKQYQVLKFSSQFDFGGQKYILPAVLPKDVYYSLQMTLILVEYLSLEINSVFSKFVLPPGRSSIFKGIKGISLIDSSYNSTFDGAKNILEMFDEYTAKVKWLVLGDIIELGLEEQEEHEKLAQVVASVKLNQIILVGPRVIKYTYPKLIEQGIDEQTIESFIEPKDALVYLRSNIKGGETILFKGARFLEGIIEHLLVDKHDIKKLCRREKIWQDRRKKWGL